MITRNKNIHYGGVNMLNNFSKEFLTIGEYFSNGGETYTQAELLLMLERDLGYSEEEGKILIDNSVKYGFIVECDNGVYTR